MISDMKLLTSVQICMTELTLKVDFLTFQPSAEIYRQKMSSSLRLMKAHQKFVSKMIKHILKGDEIQ